MDSNKINYRLRVIAIINELIKVRFDSDGRSFQLYDTFIDLAKDLGITSAQMSRVYNGVCSLSGENFFKLLTIYERLSD